MIAKATTTPAFHVGHPDIDADHAALAQLLDALETICTKPPADNGGCGQCPQTEMASCRRLLTSLGAKMQTLLLNHFQREDELMQSLPRTMAVRNHCARHRGEHVSFSTQYNLAVTRLADSAPAVAVRKIEGLVMQWVRNHTLEYDVELSSLSRNRCERVQSAHDRRTPQNTPSARD